MVKLNGIELNGCIFNASGCWCTTIEELNELKKSDSCAIVCKSSTLVFREGNEKPRKYLDKCGSINSMGVPNLGYKIYADYGNKIDKPYFQSIIPFSISDLIIILNHINQNTNKDKTFVEINLSCPNIKGKSVLANKYDIMEDYLNIIDELKTEKLIIGIKLPPYFHKQEFDDISNILMKHKKIKFITCINSLPNGLIIDPDTNKTRIKPKDGLGGIGGIYCKPTALANVRNFYNRLKGKIDIIGCGGIKNGIDAYEYILCGATCVQVGTQLLHEGPDCFQRLHQELFDYMKLRGYNKLNEFRGKLETC